MTHPPYPLGLPECLVIKGQTISAVDGRLTFEPDVGPPMSRQASALTQFMVPWQFYCNAAQLATFKNFFHVTLRQGSARFTARHPAFPEESTYLFEGPYSYDWISDDRFRVTATARRVS